MQVNLYATFRLIANMKSFEIELPPGSTVVRAIKEVVRLYPALEKHWMDQAGELHAHVLVFVNSQDVFTLENALETLLQPGDVLDFFPPVAGG
jgi:MoaD family protein